MKRTTHRATDLPRGFVRYVVNAYFPDAALNMQLAELTEKGTAIELATLIAPELAGAKMKIEMWAAEMKDFSEADRINAVVSKAIADSRRTTKPGEKLLTLIGYRSNTPEA